MLPQSHPATETSMASLCAALLSGTLGGSHCRRALAVPEVTYSLLHFRLEQRHLYLRLQALPTSVNGESGFSSLCLSSTERRPFAFSSDPLGRLDTSVNGLFKSWAPSHSVEGRV